jgi:PAS domain S-box-containing protein
VVAGGAARRNDFTHGAKSFVVRIAPYTRGDHETGTVLTFTNVTAFRASIDQAIYEREYTKTILNTIVDPIIVLSADLRVQTGNRAFYAMFGVSRDQTMGVALHELGDGAFGSAELHSQLDKMLSGAAFEPVEVEHEFPGVGLRMLQINARPFSLPRQSGSMVLLALRDVTARRRAEAASAHLASIVEFSDEAIVSESLSGTINTWNKGAEQLFGYAADEVLGKSIAILVPPDRPDEVPAILERVKRGERVEHYQTVRRRKDGSLIEIALSVSPIKDRGGKIVGASKIARDNSERRKAEETQRLLLEELQHRVKNTLTTVQAIAAQTILCDVAAAERDAFTARLHALARAHDALIQNNWDRAPLHEILSRALGPFQQERITTSGPFVLIDSEKALRLTMVLHELATNAVKYGAFSNSTGQVHIDWTVRAEMGATQLQLCWKERGGPCVEPTERKGFGSRLIKASLPDAQMAFAPEGVTCTLRVPV